MLRNVISKYWKRIANFWPLLFFKNLIHVLRVIKMWKMKTTVAIVVQTQEKIQNRIQFSCRTGSRGRKRLHFVLVTWAPTRLLILRYKARVCECCATCKDGSYVLTDERYVKFGFFWKRLGIDHRNPTSETEIPLLKRVSSVKTIIAFIHNGNL